LVPENVTLVKLSGWEHAVTIEGLLAPSTADKKVLCIAGENACPPEDVGGPGAYFDFLAAIKDPAHEEHNSMLQWITGSFDRLTSLSGAIDAR
jgi:hypothetical protein